MCDPQHAHNEGQPTTMHLNADNISEHDYRAMVEQLKFLAEYDFSVSESLDLYQGSFAFRVKMTDGSKPGVHVMRNVAACYVESPFKLMQLLMKLLDVNSLEAINELAAEVA